MTYWYSMLPLKMSIFDQSCHHICDAKKHLANICHVITNVQRLLITILNEQNLVTRFFVLVYRQILWHPQLPSFLINPDLEMSTQMLLVFALSVAAASAASVSA